MSSKEHCHGCGKLWSEESPECVFNYHKKPEKNDQVSQILQEIRLFMSSLIPIYGGTPAQINSLIDIFLYEHFNQNPKLGGKSKLLLWRELGEHLNTCTICIEDGTERCDLLDKIMESQTQ